MENLSLLFLKNFLKRFYFYLFEIESMRERAGVGIGGGRKPNVGLLPGPLDHDLS